jgi:hypothetical protein
LGNTQPFLRELGGRVHVFAHNGNLPEIEQRMEGRWQRFQPIGQTDSEIAFCILLQSLSLLWTDRRLPSVEDRVSIICSVAAEFREIGLANFIYSDGDMLFAHGHRRIQHDGAIGPPGLFLLKWPPPAKRVRASAKTAKGAMSGISSPLPETGQSTFHPSQSLPIVRAWALRARGEITESDFSAETSRPPQFQRRTGAIISPRALSV